MTSYDWGTSVMPRTSWKDFDEYIRANSGYWQAEMISGWYSPDRPTSYEGWSYQPPNNIRYSMSPAGFVIQESESSVEARNMRNFKTENLDELL